METPTEASIFIVLMRDPPAPPAPPSVLSHMCSEIRRRGNIFSGCRTAMKRSFCVLRYVLCVERVPTKPLSSPKPLLMPYAASPLATTMHTPPNPSQLRRSTAPDRHRPRPIITNITIMASVQSPTKNSGREQSRRHTHNYAEGRIKNG